MASSSTHAPYPDRTGSSGDHGSPSKPNRTNNRQQQQQQQQPLVLNSPARARLELVDMTIPTHTARSAINPEAGKTPSYELPQPSLDSEQLFTSPSPGDRDRSSKALPAIDTSVAQRTRRKNVNESNKRPTSPHITIATPTSARHHHRDNSSSSAQERRASVPASAWLPSASSPSGDAADTMVSPPLRGPPVRQSSLSKAAANAAHNLYDIVSGRKTPQSSMHPGVRPDTAGTRRHVASPDVYDETSLLANPLDDDEVTDDERDKGHKNKRQNSSSNGRWTPTILSNIIKKAGSPAHPFHHQSHHKDGLARSQPILQSKAGEVGGGDLPAVHGRSTPAKYRPSEESVAQSHPLGLTLSDNGGYYPQDALSLHQHHRGAHPLSHTHTMSTSTTSNSSHSIQMHSSPHFSAHSRHTSLHASPHTTHSRHQSMHAFGTSPGAGPSSGNTANSSPLIVPQARRGAINLRPACRKKQAALARRRRAAAQAARSPDKPLPQQMREALAMVVRAFRCPAETAKHCHMRLKTTLHTIDCNFRDPRTGQRVWKPAWLSAYIPLLIWLVVSLSSTFTVLMWHTQVFQALDRLSTYLQEQGLKGRFLLGSLIFITTFPPLPLYSTLIVLCGFSFGLWQGFVISYVAALLGAIVVFLLSRSLLKKWMSELLNKSGGLKRVVRAIEKRPKLLFLVRLAPYPYNLMNTLLASSPTLTLQTYTLCTALALPKLLVHCALGTSIKNFAAYNGAGVNSHSPVGVPSDRQTMNNGTETSTAGTAIPPEGLEDASASHTAETVKHLFGFVGVGLCIGIFIYLLSVARKAVDEELDDDEDMLDYDIVLSDQEGLSDEEDGQSDDGSGLDDDDLNIARHSSEDNKDGSIASQRASMQGAITPRVPKYADRPNGSDSTLVDGQPHLIKPHKVSGGFDNLSSTAFATSPRNYYDGNPYLAHNVASNNSSRRAHHLESQTSLADSIVEMEKHAMELEQEPLIPAPHEQRNGGIDMTSTPYTDSHTHQNSYHPPVTKWG